jgi:hypothetical protein
MTHFNQVIQLNNDGTSLLVFGEEDLAIDKFKSALEIMKRGLAKRQTRTGSQDSHHISSDKSDGPVSCDSAPRLSPLTLPCPVPEYSFVYSNALKLSRFCDYLVDSDIKFLSAAIIFNMAMVYNIKGVRESSAIEQTRSLRLYEMCLALLENLNSRHMDSFLLRVACLNNMSQIAYEQGDFDGARLMLNNVQYLMSMNVKQTFFDEDDLQGFMLNVMLMHAPSAARAA